MTSPEDLLVRLQHWADRNYPNRTQASMDLAESIGASPGTARGYIDYRLPTISYDVVYRVWQFLEDQEREDG
jgi:hypothetical protein